MTPLDRLTAALSDRYRIERELGAGGMATVYLAEDLKHHRKVAVKVLRPDIAVTMGAERFAREIEVAARLQHPHILGLLDSGEAGGFLYYVMPYVEGETLRERIVRSGELPVADTVRLVTEIAEALAVAHKAGVVHRDIKPENVLLSGRHAMVMDFGVAKAVSESSGRQQMTTAGIALGTPSYMAPEQATADPHVDGRVDLYALGVVAYEMLTGNPPFHGLSPQQTIAAHITATPVPVGQHRQGLSAELEGAVMRCLAKRPADRFQTGEELLAVLEPLGATSGGITPTHTRPMAAARSAPRWQAPLAVVVLLLLAFLGWRSWRTGGGKALDPHLVAVLPFRVAGADPSVQYLRQGMLDLLQAKLTGEGGPRAADTRSVLAAVRDGGGTDLADLPEEQVEGLARKIGAGRILQGSIVGPPDHLVISGVILEMPGGRVLTQTSVEGPKDSLFSLVDRFTAQLLALGAGATTNQLSGLTTTSLDALRAYLDGVAAYRRGAFEEATTILERAVTLDSTFALGLSALVEANGWAPTVLDLERVKRLAWLYRDRLNERDSLFLALRLGSNYPGLTSRVQDIADREKATRRFPESAEAWYHLGDALFHNGWVSDIADSRTKSRVAFEAAVDLDSLYGAPLQHLARIASAAGDTVSQRRWTTRLLTLDTVAVSSQYVELDLARHSGDRAEVERILAGPNGDGLARATLFLDPFDTSRAALLDADLARYTAQATTSAARAGVASLAIDVLRNEGRPDEVHRWLERLRELDQRGWASKVLGVALLTPSDTSDLQRAWVAIPDPMFRTNISMLRNDLAGVEAGIRALRSTAASATDPFAGKFIATYEAWLAVERNAPDADRLVAVADSTWRGFSESALFASFALMRMHERRGHPELALRAIRRRSSQLGQPQVGGLSESLRQEGRLASRVGDRAGAIKAYQQYLVLRRDPEPAARPQRDSVIAELSAFAPQEGRQ